VLLAALHSAFAASFLFAIQHGLSQTFSALLSLFAHRPGVLAIPVLVGILGLFGGVRPH
jgi:hypothetical protein